MKFRVCVLFLSAVLLFGGCSKEDTVKEVVQTEGIKEDNEYIEDTTLLEIDADSDAKNSDENKSITDDIVYDAEANLDLAFNYYLSTLNDSSEYSACATKYVDGVSGPWFFEPEQIGYVICQRRYDDNGNVSYEKFDRESQIEAGKYSVICLVDYGLSDDGLCQVFWLYEYILDDVNGDQVEGHMSTLDFISINLEDGSITSEYI